MRSMRVALMCYAVLHSSTVLQTSLSAKGLVPCFNTVHHRRNCKNNGAFWGKYPLSCQAQLRGGGDNDDPSNPKHWYSNTDPQVAVRAFARDDVLDSEIEKVLKDNGINTLADLRLSLRRVQSLIDEDEDFKMVVALEKAYLRIFKTVEEVLGGEIDFKEEYLPRTCFGRYALGAVAVTPDATKARKDGVREKAFTLVFGSSGSGKTMFALRRLPILLFGDGDEDLKNYFTVHFVAYDAVARMTSKDLAFPAAVADVVQTIIAKKILSKNLSNVRGIDLFLHVVIDEAGAEVLRENFDTADKIESLVASVKDIIPFKFLKGVHVTLVGTGLDATTALIPSETKTIKFRMQPWTIKNFEALLTEYKHPQPELVLETVANYPVLEDLISNGRCAYLLLSSIKNSFSLRKSRVKDIVKVLVREIADSYVDSNGLSKLKTPEDRFRLVRSVLREVDRSTSQPGVSFFPQFEDISSTLGTSIPNCLLDINVESSEGKLVLVGESGFALSLSPALVLVLTNLLNTDAEMSWDWNGFESTVMLSELKQMVVGTTNIPSCLDRLVLQLQAPLPEPAAKKTLSVPVVGNCTVILNGPKAGYADVIAPYRLVQAKFSRDDSTTPDLHIQEELDKMGLTVSPNHLLKQYLTDTFYNCMWQSRDDAPNPVVDANIRSTERRHRHMCYPFDTLSGRRILEEPVVVELKKGTAWCIIQDGVRQVLSVPVTFAKELPVTAVFATNCDALRLTKKPKKKKPKKAELDVVDTSVKRKKTKVTNADNENDDNSSKAAIKAEYFVIGSNDVNWQGKLLKGKEIPDGFISGLRENVEISFLFFGGHSMR